MTGAAALNIAQHSEQIHPPFPLLQGMLCKQATCIGQENNFVGSYFPFPQLFSQKITGNQTNSKSENFTPGPFPHAPSENTGSGFFYVKIFMGEKMTVYFLNENKQEKTHHRAANSLVIDGRSGQNIGS